MNYLIDTQILIWYQLNSSKLGPGVLVLINNRKNSIYISQISLFEITIKQALGKLPELDITIDSLANLARQDYFNLLELKTQHIDAYVNIPLLANHRDPFDRLLLATAFTENMPMISADENFAVYPPQIQLIANR
ncbi:type II toxin-antitoxin system VapC family toxin [Methylococcaceae bacterium WWC4]|nr:type II toxin-antitoxin system VapC family toxin [Methylococcaceae bacterium WWC4]